MNQTTPPLALTASQWTSTNLVLDAGQEGIESDTGNRKIGDGVTPWKSLAYKSQGGSGALTVISQQVLASPTTPVTFSSIPNTYENLVLEIMGRVDSVNSNENILVQLNGDTGANYDWSELDGNGSTSQVAGQVAGTSFKCGMLTSGAAPANAAGSIRMVIPSYARTTFFKTVRSTCYGPFVFSLGNLWTELVYADWRSTAAINSIKLIPGSSANFIAGTVFTLYGEAG